MIPEVHGPRVPSLWGQGSSSECGSDLVDLGVIGIKINITYAEEGKASVKEVGVLAERKSIC